MRTWIVPAGCKSVDELRLVERPNPTPGHGQVVMRVHATSLNYRDHLVAAGHYFGGAVSRDTVPLSDGAGDVVAVGPGVSRFRQGDRVAATFFQPSAAGAPPAALGSPLDGMLADHVAVHEDGLVLIHTSRPPACRAPG
jgi:NADPH:quinone reductase-like Zn-dependent oxidoreductase